jgi:hypothetical protein
LWGRIGIGGGLTTSPLPHHRPYGSRIRRFGRFSMLAPAKALACHSPRQPHARSGTLSCKRLVMRLYDRSGLRRAMGAPPLPSADSSAVIGADDSALSPFPGHATSLGTEEASRGQRSARRCRAARCIQHRPLWMEDFAVACPLVSTVPHLLSGACPSPRTFVPRVLQTPPREDALALLVSFGSTPTWTGDLHPRA